MHPYTPSVTAEDIEWLTQVLGREPRGLRAIPVRSQAGHPIVLQVASLVDNKPFPTLFWLVDETLCYEIDRLEASGLIARWQSAIDASPEWQQRLQGDHRVHIELRQQRMLEEDAQAIERLGFGPVFSRRGIGGIENFTRIRCLHTYYAAHLVVPNLIGEWLDAHWQQQKAE